jgi:hypothetical protein
MRVRCVLLSAVLVLTNFPVFTFGQSSSCTGIHVTVLNIRNSAGNVSCALFESSDGFPIEFLRYATNLMSIKIRDKQARFDFLDLQLAGNPKGRLRFFKRRKSHLQCAFVFFSQFFLRRERHESDNQSALLKCSVGWNIVKGEIKENNGGSMD